MLGDVGTCKKSLRYWNFHLDPCRDVDTIPRRSSSLLQITGFKSLDSETIESMNLISIDTSYVIISVLDIIVFAIYLSTSKSNRRSPHVLGPTCPRGAHGARRTSRALTPSSRFSPGRRSIPGLPWAKRMFVDITATSPPLPWQRYPEPVVRVRSTVASPRG